MDFLEVGLGQKGSDRSFVTWNDAPIGQAGRQCIVSKDRVIERRPVFNLPPEPIPGNVGKPAAIQ